MLTFIEDEAINIHWNKFFACICESIIVLDVILYHSNLVSDYKCRLYKFVMECCSWLQLHPVIVPSLMKIVELLRDFLVRMINTSRKASESSSKTRVQWVGLPTQDTGSLQMTWNSATVCSFQFIVIPVKFGQTKVIERQRKKGFIYPSDGSSYLLLYLWIKENNPWIVEE